MCDKRTKWWDNNNIPKNGVIVEIGVDRGINADRLYKVFNPKKMYLVDAWVYPAPNEYIELETKKDRLQEQCNKHRDFVMEKWENVENVEVIHNTSVEAAKYFEDEYFDFIYIDANHAYQAVKEDLAAWYPKLKPRGVIAGHDWSHGSVKTAVEEFNETVKRKLIHVKNPVYHSDGCNEWGLLPAEESIT